MLYKLCMRLAICNTDFANIFKSVFPNSVRHTLALQRYGGFLVYSDSKRSGWSLGDFTMSNHTFHSQKEEVCTAPL
jgi:hypothetical protein